MADFMGRVEQIKQRDGCPRTQAMRTARHEHPDEYRRFVADAPSRPLQKSYSGPASIHKFLNLVTKTQFEERCSRNQAMELVRHRQPEVYKALQES